MEHENIAMSARTKSQLLQRKSIIQKKSIIWDFYKFFFKFAFGNVLWTHFPLFYFFFVFYAFFFLFPVRFFLWFFFLEGYAHSTWFVVIWHISSPKNDVFIVLIFEGGFVNFIETYFFCYFKRSPFTIRVILPRSTVLCMLSPIFHSIACLHHRIFHIWNKFILVFLDFYLCFDYKSWIVY